MICMFAPLSDGKMLKSVSQGHHKGRSSRHKGGTKLGFLHEGGGGGGGSRPL